jgi:hypothetical protein
LPLPKIKLRSIHSKLEVKDTTDTNTPNHFRDDLLVDPYTIVKQNGLVLIAFKSETRQVHCKAT